MSEPVHGRYTTYLNHRCRCGPCTAANSTRQREYYQRVKAGDPRRAKKSAAEHGTLSMYKNQHCRCDSCKEACREDGRMRRAAIAEQRQK